MKYVSGSEKDTFNFAKKFAKTLHGGEVIGLIGDLGAGKTVFAKGLAAGLGVKQKINSPTFVLMRVYPVKKVKIKNFIHIDAYRLKSAADLAAIGAKEYFSDPSSIVLIEWADRIKALPKNKIIISFNCKNERERLLNISL
jgi:tRNA threonylcarbamoyladenosine biosynthesis protein TsaE